MSKVVNVNSARQDLVQAIDAEIAEINQRKAELEAMKVSVAAGGTGTVAKKRGRKPGNKVAKKNGTSHVSAILEVLGKSKKGLTSKELRAALASKKHEITEGTFHTTLANQIKGGKVVKSGDKGSQVYTLPAS